MFEHLKMFDKALRNICNRNIGDLHFVPTHKIEKEIHWPTKNVEIDLEFHDSTRSITGRMGGLETIVSHIDFQKHTHSCAESPAHVLKFFLPCGGRSCHECSDLLRSAFESLTFPRYADDPAERCWSSKLLS